MVLKATTHLLLLAALATPLRAQPSEEPPADVPQEELRPEPTPRDEGVELLEEPPSGGRVYRPAGAEEAASAIPGVPLPDYRPPEGSLLPEGTYLMRRRGIVVPVGDDRWAFVFDADAEGDRETAMYLMPGLQLSEMIRLVGSRPDTITFHVDGEVFVYEGRNYLLPIRYDVGADQRATRTEEVEATIEANRTLREDDDPSVEALMERLERATEKEARPTLAAPTRGADRADSDLIPERTPIVSRRGRLLRAEGSFWTFVPDNDADVSGPDAPTRPNAFILQPCLNTQALERLAGKHADRVVFIVSGALYVFEGRNHLLPTMYLIEHDRDENLTPAQ